MRSAFVLVAIALLAGVAGASETQRQLILSDLDSLQSVSDVRIAANGDWIAYTVQSVNRANDSREWAVWVMGWDSASSRKISGDVNNAYAPRWSPDGRTLAFLAADLQGSGTSQIWLYRSENEKLQQASDIDEGVADFAWSPDSKHLVLVVESGGAGSESATPIVINRFRFKRDGVGYLGDARSHLHLLDLASGTARQLTNGPHDDLQPAWSPDGSRIAFVSKRGADSDKHDNWDVYLVAPVPGAAVERLTNTEYAESNPEGWGGRPVWNPAGNRLAYTIDRDPGLSYYAQAQLATVAVSGGADLKPAGNTKRNMMSPRWSADGKNIYVLIADEMHVYLAAVPHDGGTPVRMTDSQWTIRSYDVSKTGRVVVAYGTPDQPTEIGRLESGEVSRMTTHNDSWLDEVTLGSTEVIEYESDDGMTIRGLMLKPPGYEQKRRYPAVIRVHGGPVGQFRRQFSFEWQLLAANGYLVVGVNPRGSSGRGEDFQRLIMGKLGSGDVADILAAADYIVEQGVADAERLGIGGWSYGSMLTNYTIASDSRFKAATSGAGVSNMLALYGTDEWVRHWERELGRPWERTEQWIRLSYPFLHADRISTPTLFLCGELDLNVPAGNSEQMYQALRSLDVDTSLIIYPGEYHNIGRPSFQRDVLQRYLDWYGKYLRN